MEAVSRNSSVDNRFASSAAASYRSSANAKADAAAEPDDDATTVTLSARAQELAQKPAESASAHQEERASAEQMSQLNAQVRRAYLSE